MGATALDLRDCYRECAEISRREAKNFYYGFLLLPPARRQAMCALYAFMRRTDDLADEEGSPIEKRRELESWRRDLDLALEGQAVESPILAALADTVDRYAIPRRSLHDVLDGVMMDLEPQPFATFEDLYGYCYRVASAVGLCCLPIWGFRSEAGRAEELAESCGIAMQLTNILRDVREDALQGRIYLPMEDLERFGVSPEELQGDRAGERLRALLEFEGNRARDYYRQAAPLVALVNPAGRPMLRAIVGIYRALLEKMGRRGYDVLAERIAISRWRKFGIMGQALLGGGGIG